MPADPVNFAIALAGYLHELRIGAQGVRTLRVSVEALTEAEIMRVCAAGDDVPAALDSLREISDLHQELANQWAATLCDVLTNQRGAAAAMRARRTRPTGSGSA